MRTVLSIGCGWGATEAELAKKGVEVTAIPLDSVISACAESRGIEVVRGNLDDAMEQLSGRQFDAVLMSGVLHLLQDPAKALDYARSALREGGRLVATVPAFYRLPFLWLRIRHFPRYRGWRDFKRSGVHGIGRWQARRLLRRAGFSVKGVSGTVLGRWTTLAASYGKLFETLFASEYTFVARRRESKAKETVGSLGPVRKGDSRNLYATAGRRGQ